MEEKSDEKNEELEENPTAENEGKKENIIGREIEDEMKQSYLDYSMSVIVGRALPDVRDGLKPVHRRILYTMQQGGLLHNKPFKKSANVVGNCMAKFHPHGDAAIYDSLVRMAQPFAMRYPLVDGQGNFGSIDGDSAAAMRYTEARMQKISEELLQDIEKNTVKFIPNFDNSTKEPTVLPAKTPNLLINGSSGIAVGMATNIPPHNIKEVCEGVMKIIDNPDIKIKELIETIKGTDFPTGGEIQGTKGIFEAFRNGKGRVVIRSKSHIEEEKNKTKIIVTEIPYMVNKALLLEQIAYLVKEKRIIGITDLRDESDRDGMRVVIELSKGANPDIILNQLYKHSRLQDSFGINMLALVDNTPKLMGIREILKNFLQHRQIVVRKRTEFDLEKAKERAHILEGLIIALKDIDNIIQKIKKSKDVHEALKVLMTDYDLSEAQGKAILDMKLQKLASLEQEKIRKEHAELISIIEKLKTILDDENEILNIIKDELRDMISKYGDERRTGIVAAESDIFIEEEDMIDEEDMIVTITHSGYIKKLPTETYREQRRGGKGVIAAGKKDEDFVEDIFVANTHDFMMFFTNKGKVHWLKVYQIPTASRQARGTAIVNLLNLEKEEKVTAFINVNDFTKNFLVMATERGIVKKTSLKAFSRPRKGGIIALNLEENDELISVKLTDGNKNLIIATDNGMAVRFRESNVRDMGRTARGVRGIKLREGAKVIGMVIGDESRSLLTVTENGYGKRTKITEYRLINRGGIGVANIKCTERNGKVVIIKSVVGNEGVVIITKQGIGIRVPINGISEIGRNTQGVRIIKLGQGDNVVAAAKIDTEEEEEKEELEKGFVEESEKENNDSKNESISNNP